VVALFLSGCLQVEPAPGTLDLDHLPLALPFGAPEAAPPPADAAQETLTRSDGLRANGEFEAALEALRPLLNHPDTEIAVQAGFRRAAIVLEQGEPGEAAALVENVLERYPRAPESDRLLLLRGVALKQAGDCPAAIAAFQDYLTRFDRLAAQVRLQTAGCYQREGQRRAAFEQTEQALQQGGPRLLRIDALERQAEILEAEGDLTGALARYEQLLDLGRTASYMASLRQSTARLYRALGRESAALDQLAAVVADAPGSALTVLDQLGELGALDRISYFQAGLVRFQARQYERALSNFDGALAAPGEAANHPAAAYHRAVSRVRLGAESDGAVELIEIADRYPASPYAPDGLLRGGKILESHGEHARAAAVYRRVAEQYPASKEAPEALLRLGFVHLLSGSGNLAAAAWRDLGTSAGPNNLRALGLLWYGKQAVRSGDRGSAEAAWRHAADLAPFHFGGLRSREMLEGNTRAELKPLQLDRARLEIGSADRAELQAWLAERGADLPALSAELAADAALGRADDLLAVGLPDLASWELEDLTDRAASEPPRQLVLALAERERGLHTQALRLAQAGLTSAGVGPAEAPAAIRKLLYPLPYFDLLTEHSAKQGVDPLLLAALVRQESTFQPKARSSANALGLTQVVPTTGREIARALGRANFEDADLLRPSTNLEFGAFYLSDRLKQTAGALFPALAGYNAGGGAVNGWLRQFGTDDLDLFVERIPYAETNYYVKVVYENYGVYRALYAKR
jgi:soluble lytic murein transglycosylase